MVVCKDRNCKNTGFTLIEVSVVLLVIGLIIGSVFVGQVLIRTAEIRAQIRQIESYDIAISTFRLKYKQLPGDLQADEASALGFFARSGAPGHGDGNGIVDGCIPLDATSVLPPQYGCENTLLWRDLAQTGFIEGNFTTAVDDVAEIVPGSAPATLYFPAAKLANAGSVIVQQCLPDGAHFLISYVDMYIYPDQSQISRLKNGDIFAIDSKMDDGRAVEGKVRMTSNLGLLGAALPGGFWCHFKDPTTNQPLLAIDCADSEGNYRLSTDDSDVSLVGVGSPTRCYPMIKSSAM